MAYIFKKLWILGTKGEGMTQMLWLQVAQKEVVMWQGGRLQSS